MAQILMSKENPTGWKLEDLLQQIQRELELKNMKLVGSDQEVLQCAVSLNLLIDSSLEKARGLQLEIMASFAETTKLPEDPLKPRFEVGAHLQDCIDLLHSARDGRYTTADLGTPHSALEIHCFRQGLLGTWAKGIFITDRGVDFLAWYEQEFPKCST
ncbi:MAG: hypothetical protein ACRCTP_03710 [Aeromonas popoffii]|uniref:hypothetical protein n=1 Tax=Aeromonas popoffii TaxID=70856 RepID=UPI003F3E191B